MAQIFPIDFDEKLTMAQDDYILFSDSEDGNKIKKAQYKNLKGEKGDPGTPGQDGADGAAATITVGSVSTGAAGSSATVVNSGTSSAAVLDFTIPQGVAGTPGTDGNDGAAATITVGTTTTLPAGSSATVENVGTSSAAVLNFGIPQGTPGTGSGDVNGPASSTDDNIATFDGATGKLIQDSGISISDINTKTFYLSSTSDLINAQAAYDWYYDGKNPIVIYNDKAYVLHSSDSVSLMFMGGVWSELNANSTTKIGNKTILFSISSGNVTSITEGINNSNNVLKTDVNYSSPYTPAYDGSPATKKYVDDKKSTISVTLTSAGWSSQTQTVTATGVTASNIVIVSPVPSDFADYTEAVIYCSVQASNSLTFTCDTEPTNDIDVNVVILN